MSARGPGTTTVVSSAPATRREQEYPSGMRRRRIGVVAGAREGSPARLLAALEQLFPVTFEPRGPEELRDLDGVLSLDPGTLGKIVGDVPVLATSSRGASLRAGALVEFSGDPQLPRPLRGRRLVEGRAPGRLPWRPGGRDCVLASVEGRPVWWRSAGTGAGGLELSAFAADELQLGEALREHLRAGRFMGLVPLLHFLGGVCGELNWSERALQASFVVDDPNLHRPSYGFLSYPDLISHARAHGYHVGLAMVPLDGWLASRRASALIRENRASISVLVHGNDHVARELGRLSTDVEAERALGQALRRIESFERRSGVAVRRVMAPPHGACSEAALRAMFRLGFDAACISRPYPWRDGLPSHSPLAGWCPAEIVAGGLPVLPRSPISQSREDLVFRALLGQPLIIYAHHLDFAEGLEPFAQAAEDVNRLGEVAWLPLDQIAAGGYSTMQAGEVLVIRMHSRRIALEVPKAITGVRVEILSTLGEPLWRGIRCGACLEPMTPGATPWRSAAFAVDPGARVEISLAAAAPLDPYDALAPRRRPWPALRRVLVEGRDRARPLIAGRARRG
jgi:hypothetical protein